MLRENGKMTTAVIVTATVMMVHATTDAALAAQT